MYTIMILEYSNKGTTMTDESKVISEDLVIYSYTPTDDITILELSEIMKVLFVSLIEGIQGQTVRGKEPLQIDDEVYNVLPPHVTKHFSKD